MAGYRWSISTPQPHVVEVQHAIHSARVRIKVDGTTVFGQDGGHVLWDSGFCHDFMIDGKQCRLTIRGALQSAEYDLKID